MNSIEDCRELCVVPSNIPLDSEVLYVVRRAVRTRSAFETEIDVESKDAKKVKMDLISSANVILRAEGADPEEISVESDQISVSADEEGDTKDAGDDTGDDDTEGAMKASEEVLTHVVIVISGSDGEE